MNIINEKILTNEEFTKLIKIFNIFKDSCNDIDIYNGLIRQQSNSKDTIFSVDLSSIIDFNISFINIKEKIDLFNSLSSDNIKISIIEKDNINQLVIADNTSNITFKMIDSSFINNKFIKDEDFSTIISIEEENKICDISIDKTICNRIKKICKILDINNIQIKFDQNKLSITSSTINKDNNILFIGDLPCNVENQCYINITLVPFLMNIENLLNLKIYFRQNQVNKNYCITSFNFINNDIEIKMYTASKINI